MEHHDIFENRKQFQLERLILFSDAVFAIAITLLIIEIKLPHSDWSHPISQNQLNVYLIDVIPNIIGFVFSFFIIGFYWTIHHRIFGHLIAFDGKVIWLNLLMLFFIVFLPFTTSLSSEFGYLSESFIFYWLNVGLIGLISVFLQFHISNQKKNLSIGFEDKNYRRYTLGRAMLTSFIFILGAILAMTNSLVLQIASRYIYVLIFPGIIILKKVYKERKNQFVKK